MTRLGAAMDVRFGVSVETFVEYLGDLGLDHLELKREYLEGHPDAPTPAELATIAERHDVTVTYHTPFRDWNLGSFNDAVRRASIKQVKQTLEDAATAGASGVVVHGGYVPLRYPSWVRAAATEHARESLRECAEYARRVGVPLCLENQPHNDAKKRHTTTPDDLAEVLDAIDVGSEYLRVTLDVGHANVNGFDVETFVERFGDRIHVCHLHDNDGTGDSHDPLSEYDHVLDSVPAEYFVFEMKSVADVARCVGADVSVPEEVPTP